MSICLLAAQIILLDILLSGDNAIVIALAAAGLPQTQRRIAISLGMVLAVILRIAFCFLTIKLYALNAVQLIGGILLFGIAIKLFIDDNAKIPHPTSCLFCAIISILVADVSMSLDNVLAVSAIARDHYYILAFGLVLSVGIMAIAAEKISGLINRSAGLKIAGAAMITFIALEMIGKSLVGFGVSSPILTKLFS